LYNTQIGCRFKVYVLSKWESLEMVQRYTRSVTFNDAVRFYKPPLS
jgi:heme-degrading monooxygenase HmoA